MTLVQAARLVLDLQTRPHTINAIKDVNQHHLDTMTFAAAMCVSNLRVQNIILSQMTAAEVTNLNCHNLAHYWHGVIGPSVTVQHGTVSSSNQLMH